MKITIDTQAGRLTRSDGTELDLFSDDAFEILSDLWVNVGWNQKYPYTFSWMGRPIIQLPEDMIRYQEAVFQIQPDVIIETGIAHGGSLIYSAGLCKILGKGRVIGVDIEIRPHNREAIEAHPLYEYITMLEGSSIDSAIVDQVRSQIKPDDKVLVVLDSNHSYAHVSEELKAYAPMVTKGSYIISTDGVMENLTEVPRGQGDWDKDNPAQAARDFADQNPDFILNQPDWAFNESTLSRNITHWPDAWLMRT